MGFKMYDHIISKDVILNYPKDQWRRWTITGENIYQDGTKRWELRNTTGTACYGKEFVAEHYVKCGPALEILYG